MEPLARSRLTSGTRVRRIKCWRSGAVTRGPLPMERCLLWTMSLMRTDTALKPITFLKPVQLKRLLVVLRWWPTLKIVFISFLMLLQKYMLPNLKDVFWWVSSDNLVTIFIWTRPFTSWFRNIIGYFYGSGYDLWLQFNSSLVIFLLVDWMWVNDSMAHELISDLVHHTLTNSKGTYVI